MSAICLQGVFSDVLLCIALDVDSAFSDLLSEVPSQASRYD